MAELKPAYLIHGDDHGAISERRARLRALAADGPGGPGSVESLEGDATPERLAQALAAMTLAVSGRVVLVDGVERWRAADVEKHLAPALSAIEPGTTVALFAREGARAKAPPAIHAAVKRAGGQVLAQMVVKPWELPGWLRAQAERFGLTLDGAASAALIAHVGERQQRLLRELEKLALALADGNLSGDPAAGARTAVGVEDVERYAAPSAQRRAYSLADALVAGDRREATTSYLRLRRQGEQLSGLIYMIAQRLRDALAVALALQAGAPVAEIKRTLRMPSRAAVRFVADVQRSDPDRLRDALGVLADLELDSRGGAALAASRTALACLGEDTLALRAIDAMTSQSAA